MRGIGLPKKKREEKERVDAAAAVLILQAWLDRQPKGEEKFIPDPQGGTEGEG